MAPFEALYGRRCRSPIGWFEIGEAEVIGPNLMHQAMKEVKIITDRLKIAQIHQKFYSDVRCMDLEFKKDDWVFLKVSPMKGIMQFEMSLVHQAFHVSMLKKVVRDLSLIVPVEAIEVNEELTYEKIPVAILDRPTEVAVTPATESAPVVDDRTMTALPMHEDDVERPEGVMMNAMDADALPQTADEPSTLT
ncbi:uncharacterized protein [Nicotiana tomentosiformis]|uniref:uncharacterized protein n=1 Tax=Nicotiana tomentosiformis TaxID=4098 RepID=UPI00388CA9ED